MLEEKVADFVRIIEKCKYTLRAYLNLLKPTGYVTHQQV